MISGSRQKVLVIRSRIVPLLSLGPNLLGLTLITAETLPTNITDTASVPSQPLLAQPMVAVTYWKWDNEGQELLSCSYGVVPSLLPFPRAPTLLFADLTSGTGGSIAAKLTHLTGCSVEALLAAAFSAAQEPVLALPMA